VSQITSYTTEIRLDAVAGGADLQDDPGWGLLRAAVEAAAVEHRGKVGDHVLDYFLRRRTCDIALYTPAFQRGVGIEVDRATGEVRFLYDDYERPDLAAEYREDIMQNFVALAVARALKDMNYDVEVKDPGRTAGRRRAVVVRGEL
jgi:hypothetical protein